MEILNDFRDENNIISTIKEAQRRIVNPLIVDNPGINRISGQKENNVIIEIIRKYDLSNAFFSPDSIAKCVRNKKTMGATIVIIAAA